MIRNYLKIGIRNLIKGKAFSIINILGLAIGMAAFLLIIQYVRFEKSYEDFNANVDNIYRVTLDMYDGNEYIVTDCETYGPLGPLLKDKYPEVKEYARMFYTDVVEVKSSSESFYESQVYFADPSVFDVFSYYMLKGNKEEALNKSFQVVLTHSTALKYFDTDDVLGKSMNIDGNEYQVTGVMADIPPNTHLKFDLLLSHQSIPKIYDWYEKYAWQGNNEYTYLLMQPGTDLPAFNKKLEKLSEALEDVEEEVFKAGLISDIHLYSDKTYEPEPTGGAQTVSFLLLIAIFIIAIAWVNYINLSTSRAISRAREVGVRKVLGSAKGQLVFQFLFESILVNLIAIIIAFTLMQISLPYFRDISGQPIALNVVTDYQFWILLFAIFIIGSLLSGIYPAMVLSGFKPVVVLKGKLKNSSHGQWLRKALVVFQFSCTIFLIIGTAVVYLQLDHLRTRDLGMKLEHTLTLRGPQINENDSILDTKLQGFKNQLLNYPNIQNVAFSESVPGLSLHELSSSTGIRRWGDNSGEGNGLIYYVIRANADFVPTLSMEVMSGHNFDNTTAQGSQILINQRAAEVLGFESPEAAIGEKITYYYDQKPSTIIGVIKNFYQRSPKDSHLPMLFPYRPLEDYISIKIGGKDTKSTLSTIEKEWNTLFPESTFDYFFLDKTYDQQFKADANFGAVITVFAVLAIFIACLGLFGLSSFNIAQRNKEMGIRKILGASLGEIVTLLSKGIAISILIANVLAIPLAYFSLKEWLASYINHIELSWWLFVFPLFVVGLLAMVTIGFNTIKTAIANPVDSLRQE
ncbi:ABC transporter permease [Fulvivirga maritima]|uniref:ABC transporter permease n=1 Tax=Fulvivirga maritima TaxID=2904247 RepID=UPI001F260B5D|nr:ABC transporter permease [Fulvivirga maritima]UII26091.1 ABC transporter permease [Fulvivirga maritima]